jgi:hypothetical protein
MMLKINPRVYLKSDVVNVFAEVANGVQWLHETRRKMLEDGFGDHVSDYDAQIGDMVRQLSLVGYSSGFYDFAITIVEDLVNALVQDDDFNIAYQNFSWDDLATMKSIVHRAQTVIEKYFETNPDFKNFKRNVFVHFDMKDINEQKGSLGSHTVRGDACSLDDDGQECIFTSHKISINIHESALGALSGPNGVLSVLIHENMHALESMIRCYAENLDSADRSDDHNCLLASQIFYPDQETRSYAYSLYWEHVSERFCRTIQVFFESCFEKKYKKDHMLSHPEFLKAKERMNEFIHHPF